MVPPFSVLNTREGHWQTRKRQWIGIGIRSELGRGYTKEAAAYGKALGKSGSLNERYRNNMSRRYSDAQGKGLLKPIAQDLRVPSPGGTPMPSTRKIGGTLVRGDSTGKPLDRGLTYRDLVDVDKYRHQKSGVVDDEPLGGTSIFDPVLCELVYRWFCKPGGRVLDLFAGGSVRGIVAGELGLHYTGIDLSKKQLEANEQQATEIGTEPRPDWIYGDSANVLKLINRNDFDLIFSCPPYGNLERYSDDPRDLSTLDIEDFDEKYGQIIIDGCSLLKEGSFACFVVGDYRDKQTGYYSNLPGITIDAFRAAGLCLYNYAILLNVAGSLPLRINAQFRGSRKLGKCHQDILVFCKGNPKDFTKEWKTVFVEESDNENE